MKRRRLANFSRRYALHAVAAVAIFTGCGRRSETKQPPLESSPPTAASEPRDSPPGNETVPEAPAVRILPDGCFADVPRQASAGSKLDVLARDCAPDSVPLLVPSSFQMDSTSYTMAFALDATTRCFRVLAALETDVPLTATLRGPSGVELARTSLGAGFSVLGERGPICTSTAGEHRVSLHAAAPSRGLLSVSGTTAGAGP